jgi:Na+/H+-dicarboxylate symporter
MILIPVMPLFIFGSTLKLQHEGMLSDICRNYLQILFIFLVSSYSFVLFQYFALAKFNFAKFILYIKNISPAVVAAFGAASSAAALPVSLKAAYNNLERKSAADLILPTTVNIHLVGDCFFIPMIAIAVIHSFGVEHPTFFTYLIFSLHFVLAKFAVAAVPGGGVLVMLPVLQQYLGFSSDMLSLVFALYVLFDPFITACNVAGNGAFVILFDKLSSFLFKPLKRGA